MGLELSMKDAGLIVTPKIDGNGNTFLRREYYYMKKDFGHRLIEIVRKKSRHSSDRQVSPLFVDMLFPVKHTFFPGTTLGDRKTCCHSHLGNETLQLMSTDDR